MLSVAEVVFVCKVSSIVAFSKLYTGFDFMEITDEKFKLVFFSPLFGYIQSWPADRYATWKVASGSIILGKRQDEAVKHFDDCPSKNWLQIVVIIIFVVTFIQDIYSGIIETNHVSRVYTVAAVLYLQYVLHIMLCCVLKAFVLSH